MKMKIFIAAIKSMLKNAAQVDFSTAQSIINEIIKEAMIEPLNKTLKDSFDENVQKDIKNKIGQWNSLIDDRRFKTFTLKKLEPYVKRVGLDHMMEDYINEACVTLYKAKDKFIKRDKVELPNGYENSEDDYIKFKMKNKRELSPYMENVNNFIGYISQAIFFKAGDIVRKEKGRDEKGNPNVTREITQIKEDEEETNIYDVIQNNKGVTNPETAMIFKDLIKALKMRVSKLGEIETKMLDSWLEKFRDKVLHKKAIKVSDFLSDLSEEYGYSESKMRLKWKELASNIRGFLQKQSGIKMPPQVQKDLKLACSEVALTQYIVASICEAILSETEEQKWLTPNDYVEEL